MYATGFASAAALAVHACHPDDAAAPLDVDIDSSVNDDATALIDAGSANDGMSDGRIDVAPATDAGPAIFAAHGTVSVDGLANEPIWAAAQGVTFDTDYAGKATGVQTTVKFAWSAAGLAMFASTEKSGLNTDLSKPTNVDRQKLYDEDCVELFFTPSPLSPSRYYEIEVGPYGHFLDLAVDLDASTYDTSWSSSPLIATKPDPTGKRADIEALFAAKEVTSVLAAGKAFRIGLFRLEGKTSDPGGRLYLAWSPPLTAKPSFHVPSAFGTLTLAP